MWGMARGPYEMSPGRTMPFVYTPDVNTVTQLSRTLRTLNTNVFTPRGLRHYRSIQIGGS